MYNISAFFIALIVSFTTNRSCQSLTFDLNTSNVHAERGTTRYAALRSGAFKRSMRQPVVFKSARQLPYLKSL